VGKELKLNPTAVGLDEFIQVNAGKQFSASNDQNLNFDTEKRFAVQQIMKNDYSLGAARKNPQSVVNAVENISAIGLSLNPASAHAYLVPRDGAICLDVSYRGIIQLATNAGIVEWVRAAVVYADDNFSYRGPAKEPEHISNPFAKKDDRGEVIGAYCIAKTKAGDILSEAMSREEIDEIRGVSKAGDSSYGPWVNYFTEMCKKTVIKRASKTWPYSGGRVQLDRAVEIAHEADGFSSVVEREPSEFRHSPEQYVYFEEAFTAGDSVTLYCIKRSVDNELFAGLVGALLKTVPRGNKAKEDKRLTALLADGQYIFEETVLEIDNAFLGDDKLHLISMIEDFTREQIELLLKELNTDCADWVISVIEDPSYMEDNVKLLTEAA
jgi:recombination protein RecT